MASIHTKCGDAAAVSAMLASTSFLCTISTGECTNRHGVEMIAMGTPLRARYSAAASVQTRGRITI